MKNLGIFCQGSRPPAPHRDGASVGFYVGENSPLKKEAVPITKYSQLINAVGKVKEIKEYLERASLTPIGENHRLYGVAPDPSGNEDMRLLKEFMAN